MGGGGSKSNAQSGANLLPFAKQFEGETRALRGSLFGDITEALRTGGVGANVPIIQSAVSGSRSALSSALQGSSEGLSRAGLSGTPFGQRQMAQQRQGGQQELSQIPTQLAQQLIQMATAGVGLAGGTLGPLASAGTSRGKSGHGGILN